MIKKRFVRPVTVMLEPEAFIQIKMKTDEDGVSISDWIRHAIQRRFDVEDKAQSVADEYEREELLKNRIY